ncbi:MAG: hypothetical protein M3Q45_13135, partial [Chloroflexota bacterium]|nr:hypothetical protein [Chloroflexota bacterium]
LALHETGIRGALALCDLLGPPNVAGAPPDSLPRQRLFLLNGQPISEENRIQWRKTLAQQGGIGEQAHQLATGLGDLLMMALSPRQARDRARDMATRKARSRLYQRRDALEAALVEGLGKQAGVLREALRAQVNACAAALAKANQEASRLADRIDPRLSDGKPSTSMYYELETGAVGRDYLQHFYRKAGAAVTAADAKNAITPLIQGLVHGLHALSPDQIYAQLSASISDNTLLLERVHSLVDINHIITTQHSDEVAHIRQRPDNRIHQWLDRLNPYIRWDADRYSFHESNLEHIRLAAVPTSRRDDPNLAAATVGQEDIKWVPTGDPLRMVAVWIVHGLPVSLLEGIEEYRAQYENSFDFPVREEFHLDPSWVDLPEVTPELDERFARPAVIPRMEAGQRRRV